METKKIDRKVLANKLANGEKLSDEEVLALNAIATEEEAKVEKEKEAKKLQNYVEKCVAELQKFEATDAKGVKAKLRAMANDVPVSANGSTYKAPGSIDPQNCVKGSVAEFIVNTLTKEPMTREKLGEAVVAHFPDRKPANVEFSVSDSLKRLGKHVSEKDGILSIA
jgi:uncharacterized FlaG/YvyC family protein